MGAEQEETPGTDAPPPTVVKWPFFQRHFSEFVGPSALVVVGVAFGVFFLNKSSREEVMRLSGKLTTLEVVRESSFLFTVDRFADRRFLVERLSQADALLLGTNEKRGSELEFAVEREKLESESFAPVPVVELSSRTNVYLYGDSAGDLLRKGRMLAGFLAFCALAAAAWLIRGLRRLHAAELIKPPAHLVYDPLLVSLARFVFGLRGEKSAWAKAVMASEQERIARKPPRQVTAAPKHVRAVEALVKSGHLDAQNQNGQTALHIAAFQSNVEAVKLLLQKGAKVDVPDNKGQTPLMVAIGKGSLGVVTQLVDAGADVLFVDDDGASVLDHAKKNERAVAVLDLISKAVAKKQAEAKAQAASGPSGT